MAEARDHCLVILSSGGGGNLRFIRQAVTRGWLPREWRIIVLADRECGATEYAQQQGLEWTCADFRQEKQDELIQVIKSYSPLAVLTTVHRILSERLVSEFSGKLFNLHYSLLPAFGGSIGSSPVKAAMQHGVRLGGVTVHKVTAALDAGPPVVQVAMPFSPNEDLDELMDCVFRAGCIALFVALRMLLSYQSDLSCNGQTFLVKKRNALLSPAMPLPEEMADERFWALLK